MHLINATSEIEKSGVISVGVQSNVFIETKAGENWWQECKELFHKFMLTPDYNVRNSNLFNMKKKDSNIRSVANA